MLKPHDISIAIETEENKVYYIHWSEMTDNQKQAFINGLKTESYKEIGNLIKSLSRSSLYDSEPTRSLTTTVVMDTPPQHVEQTSLGQNEDFGNEPDVEDAYEKAKNGDEKALRLIGAWANQGDKRAKIFLIEISKTPEQPRKRVMIL